VGYLSPGETDKQITVSIDTVQVFIAALPIFQFGLARCAKKSFTSAALAIFSVGTRTVNITQTIQLDTHLGLWITDRKPDGSGHIGGIVVKISTIQVGLAGLADNAGSYWAHMKRQSTQEASGHSSSKRRAWLHDDSLGNANIISNSIVKGWICMTAKVLLTL
jgi:hypothetical protein